MGKSKINGPFSIATLNSSAGRQDSFVDLTYSRLVRILRITRLVRLVKCVGEDGSQPVMGCSSGAVHFMEDPPGDPPFFGSFVMENPTHMI